MKSIITYTYKINRKTLTKQEEGVKLYNVQNLQQNLKSLVKLLYKKINTLVIDLKRGINLLMKRINVYKLKTIYDWY